MKLLHKKFIFIQIILLLFTINLSANDGYKLWLQYDKVKNEKLLLEYQTNILGLVALGNSETMHVALKELLLGLEGMLGKQILNNEVIDGENLIIFGSKSVLDKKIIEQLKKEFAQINDEGFIIKNITYKGKNHIVITGKTDVGVLYGVFNFLRTLQTNKSITNLSIVDSPKVDIRMLNH